MNEKKKCEHCDGILNTSPNCQADTDDGASICAMTGKLTAPATSRIYIAMFDHYWGRGDSVEAALKEARKQGGRGKDYVVCRLPEGTDNGRVDQLGRVRWNGVDGEVEVVKRSGKCAKDVERAERAADR